MTGPTFTRRGFLRVAAGAAAVAATGAACGSGSDKAESSPAAPKGAASEGGRTLRIAQWNNYVAGYDRWWDDEYTKQWGERNGIEVVVDHFDITQTSPHAEAEVASQRGHDLFHMFFVSPAVFEDHVIDHREIVDEVEAKVGKMTPFVERSIFNPRTQKYFGFSDSWIPCIAHYRTDLWNPIGLRPDTWENILAAGQRLKVGGHPIGIGLGLDSESNSNLMGLLHAFGASIQDEEANIVINSPATVEAVKIGAAIYRSGMNDEVLGWDVASNNRYLISGRGSLILNGIPALRAIEIQDPGLAAKIQLLPIPAGPRGRLSPYGVSVYMVWKFAENQEVAKQFLVDLASDYREAFIRSQFLQMPSFPGAIKELGELVTNGRYGLLTGAAAWTTNLGYPGYSNAATHEVAQASLISKMFAVAARGEKTAEQAVADAEAEIKPIFGKWRQQGKI